MKLLKKNQLGFSGVEVLIVVAVVAVISGAAYYVGVARNKTDKAETVAKTSPAPTTDTATKDGFTLPAGWKWYDGKKYGFKFAYPKSLGEATVQTVAGMDENADDYVSQTEYDNQVSFSNAPNDTDYLVMNFATSGYQMGGKGSTCNIGLTEPPVEYKQLDLITESWAISRRIIDQPTINGIEVVSYTDDSDANCSDFEMTVYKKLLNNPTFKVVEVYYTGNSKKYGTLTSQDAYETAYNANPDSVIDPTVRNEVLNIAKSVTEL